LLCRPIYSGTTTTFLFTLLAIVSNLKSKTSCNCITIAWYGRSIKKFLALCQGQDEVVISLCMWMKSQVYVGEHNFPLLWSPNYITLVVSKLAHLRHFQNVAMLFEFYMSWYFLHVSLKCQKCPHKLNISQIAYYVFHMFPKSKFSFVVVTNKLIQICTPISNNFQWDFNASDKRWMEATIQYQYIHGKDFLPHGQEYINHNRRFFLTQQCGYPPNTLKTYPPDNDMNPPNT
jgi:hypothetical protein